MRALSTAIVASLCLGAMTLSPRSQQVLQDDVLARLLTFPNVLITAHQAFLTREALANIADTTLGSVAAFERGENLVHQVETTPR